MAGATPITENVPPASAIELPIASARPPKRRCQNSWLITAYGAAPSARSSSVVNVRPSVAGTPSVVKYEPETIRVTISSGWPPAIRARHAVVPLCEAISDANDFTSACICRNSS